MPGVAVPQEPARRRGRRRSGADTREQVLTAARAAFAERGYDGATVRHIAERAGVDAAMVHHWFGSKDALFTASLDIPLDPAAVFPELLHGPRDQLGERLVTRFLTLWDATGGAPLASMLRSVAAHDDAARMLRDFVTRVILTRVVATLGPDQPDLRAALVGSQLIGLGMARYVVKLEPLASADHATVVAAVAPTVQRYLTGPLG
ncbi:TetR/AcrR family transcriptional regulator [Pseudonocardia hydrocarbonoxydans]|uniref:TetR family transcriptional regulator n=1 Tax=Pseudonocardia hydrocarbonoxydans TaxID=76726 RepID=A0A4Y3WJV0_9PSEU|nr:TetR family transcriptional regulator [Pseudonocardia hydrocarbonoxydans]GEC18521.1 TetR family transcriptional regulator [Pseudonocardia hydrocarbonoxydans]